MRVVQPQTAGLAVQFVITLTAILGMVAIGWWVTANFYGWISLGSLIVIIVVAYVAIERAYLIGERVSQTLDEDDNGATDDDSPLDW